MRISDSSACLCSTDICEHSLAFNCCARIYESDVLVYEALSSEALKALFSDICEHSLAFKRKALKAMFLDIKERFSKKDA